MFRNSKSLNYKIQYSVKIWSDMLPVYRKGKPCVNSLWNGQWASLNSLKWLESVHTVTWTLKWWQTTVLWSQRQPDVVTLYLDSSGSTSKYQYDVLTVTICLKFHETILVDQKRFSLLLTSSGYAMRCIMNIQALQSIDLPNTTATNL